MQRKIKFRVYNKKRAKWVHGPHENPSLDGVNLFGESILLGGFMTMVPTMELQHCVALQYTGIEDKNGREIFEGDIIECDDVRFEVFWAAHISAFRCRTREDFQDSLWILGSISKLIGNKFDNPELLN